VLGALIGGTSYAIGFAAAALAPLLAIAVVPVAAEARGHLHEEPERR
jgi:hypothetical protein